jgi:hypothetical protein
MAFPGLVRNSLAGCAQTAEKEARFRKNQALRHMRNIEEALECFALGVRGVRRDEWCEAGLAKSLPIFYVIPGMNSAASNTDLLSRAYAAYFRSGAVDLPSNGSDEIFCAPASAARQPRVSPCLNADSMGCCGSSDETSTEAASTRFSHSSTFLE